jgi:hypothetical protein
VAQQRQRNAGLEAENAAVAGEQAGEVRSRMTAERLLAQRACAGAQQAAVGEYHVKGQRRFRRNAPCARAVADRVLRHRPADGRGNAGERPTERRTQALALQRVGKLKPGDARLDGDVAVELVDLDDAVQAAHVDEQVRAVHRIVAIGVGRAAAAHGERQLGGRRRAHHGLQFLDRARTRDRARHDLCAVDVGGEVGDLGRVGQQVVRTDDVRQRARIHAHCIAYPSAIASRVAM